MIKIKLIAFSILFINSMRGISQELLTVDEAIKIALEKNHAVLIQKNELEIAKGQNNMGNAGMAPQVSLNGAYNFANLNSYQEFSTGTTQERKGAQSENLALSANVSWTIFDGLKMFAIKKRLTENEKLSALELKQQLETTVESVVSAYYNIVKTQALIKTAKQNLEFYSERKKITKLKKEIGSESNVDYLLSQSDENKALSSIIQLEIQLIQYKTNLNKLLNKPSDNDFKTLDSIVINYSPNIDELKKSIISSNTSLLISKQNELIAQQSIKEASSTNLPIVQLNGAYNFTRNQSQAGLLFLNKQNGLNAGITASWLLFNGNKNNKLIKEKNILFLNQKYITEQTLLFTDADVSVAYKTFMMNKEIVNLETQNLQDAKSIISVSLERYKIGKATILETIEVQKNLEDAQSRYIEALYNMKIAETNLLKMNGKLVN